MPVTEALLDDLTEPQRAAVTHRDGALLVLAGPGSGKTTVVTRRIAFLIANGIEPWQILALTFTNKAAGEMRQRVETLLAGQPPRDGSPTVATFHSFCARLLRRFAEPAGIAPRFSIYDETLRREALKHAISDGELSAKNWTPAAVGAVISNAKNRLLDAKAFAAEAGDFYMRSIARVYTAYEKILRANDALDFDDLLLRTAALLRRDADVRTRLQRRYRYLLIDEYQDTNRAQFVIAHALADGHGNICVVGDPDQAIYAWRGADITNILDFEAHHPDAVVVPLGQNFRSTGHLVGAADGLIRHNRRRRHKDLFTELAEGERPTVIACRDEHHEAAVIAEFLHNAGTELDLPWKEMAVLYRVNALSRVLEASLRNARIPYVIARGTAFFDRKEVRDALAYLRVVANPNDEISLGRILNTPSRGIGKISLGSIERYAVGAGLRQADALRQVAAVEGLSKRAKKSIGTFVELIDGFRARAAGDTARPADATALAGLVEHVIRHSGLERMHRGDTDEERQRLANLSELVSAAAEFSPPDGLDAPDDLPGWLGLFLESVALVSDADAIDPERGTVTLMSLHAAKGLEFEAVALIGMEQNLLPHARAVANDAELEEERRLCFVGMTRAKRRLLLTRAAVRTHRGVREGTIASCFLGELPRERVDFVDKTGDAGFDDLADRAVGPGAAGGFACEFPVGCIVRHPAYGLGRVEDVTPRARGASARVAFPTVGIKTLILENAPLERVG